jgi:hypothetical protein
MINKIACLFFFFYLPSVFCKGNDSLFYSAPIIKYKKNKSMSGLRLKKDTLNYILPVLTIHLGASFGMSNGNARFNPDNAAGTRVNFKNDLGFPSNTIFPRINIVLAPGKNRQFLFDINNISIKKTALTPRELQVRDLNVPANTSLRSKFNLFFTNLSYRRTFIGKKHFNFGGLIGLDLHQYSLKLRNNETGTEAKNSFAVWSPLVGLDIFGFLHQDFFFRGTFNVVALPFHNYDLTQISFKSYFEYYFIKNFGLGLSYNYFYSDIREFRKVNGSLKYQIHSVSLFASFRFY